ncbi:MAG: hypothetical protein PVF50_11080 [Gammaproteobacteria bacterium]|jgi:hypothetical protein
MHTNDQESADDRFRKVEEREGIGTVSCAGVTYENVRYAIVRFQGMTRAGLPVPGVHRFDGRIALENGESIDALVGSQLRLHLKDGSVITLEMLDGEGRVVAHGHGPGKCLCC